MNAEPSAELINAGLSGVIGYSLLQSLAVAASVSPPEILDQLACHVAQRYACGAMSFEDADAIMNAAYSVSVTEEFWANHDRSIPPVMYEVYEAFDAGEHYHHGDACDIEPEVKYTRPLIQRFLAARENGA
jgi:hypothetical protein